MHISSLGESAYGMVIEEEVVRESIVPVIVVSSPTESIEITRIRRAGISGQLSINKRNADVRIYKGVNNG